MNGIPVSANTLGIASVTTGLPNMRGTIIGWFQTLTVGIITDTLVDYQTVETVEESTYQGVIQPLSNEDLRIKPEGQRSWIWQMLHCTPDLVLQTDDECVIEGTRYRVMAKKDYTKYGYVRYELINAYTVTPTEGWDALTEPWDSYTEDWSAYT